jgi:hypothetical protein
MSRFVGLQAQACRFLSRLSRNPRRDILCFSLREARASCGPRRGQKTVPVTTGYVPLRGCGEPRGREPHHWQRFGVVRLEDAAAGGLRSHSLCLSALCHSVPREAHSRRSCNVGFSVARAGWLSLCGYQGRCPRFMRGYRLDTKHIFYVSHKALAEVGSPPKRLLEHEPKGCRRETWPSHPRLGRHETGVPPRTRGLPQVWKDDLRNGDGGQFSVQKPLGGSCTSPTRRQERLSTHEPEAGPGTWPSPQACGERPGADTSAYSGIATSLEKRSSQ